MSKLLFVTDTKVETQTVLNVFCPAHNWKRQVIDGKTYYALGEVGGMTVYMVESEIGISGPGAALITVKNAIKNLSPVAAIMVGIASGTRPDKQKLGDILVSQQIRSYEPQKVTRQNKSIPIGDRVTVNPNLLDKFRSGELTWKGAPVHIGLILSGEKLIEDQTFRDRLLKQAPEAIGGDVGGVGLYSAASEKKVDWILVKAICDFADGKRTDAAQRKAARNAASYVLYVIKLGGLAGTEQDQTRDFSRLKDQIEGYKGRRREAIKDQVSQYYERSAMIQVSQMSRKLYAANIGQKILDYPHVVLLGEPDSGMTTILEKVESEYLAPDRDFLPVLIPLRKFNGKTDFKAFVNEYLPAPSQGEDADQKISLVWLLDGLNEVLEDSGGREKIIDFIDKEVRFGPQTRIIVSCHKHDYKDDFPDLTRVELCDLNPHEIYANIKSRLPEKADTFWSAVGGNAELLQAWYRYADYELHFWDEPTKRNVTNRPLDYGIPDGEKAAILEHQFNNDQLENARRAAINNEWMQMCRDPFTFNKLMEYVANSKNNEKLPDSLGKLLEHVVDNRFELLSKQFEAEATKHSKPTNKATMAQMRDLIQSMLQCVAVRMQLKGCPHGVEYKDTIRFLKEDKEFENEMRSYGKSLTDVDGYLARATAAGLIQWENNIAFSHQLIHMYFAACKLRETLRQESQNNSVHDFTKRWWSATQYKFWHKSTEILGQITDAPLEYGGWVARWLAPFNSEIAIEVMPPRCDRPTADDLSTKINELAKVKYEALRKEIIREAKIQAKSADPRGRAVAYRVLGLLSLIDMEADDRPGVGIYNGAGLSQGLPYIEWCAVPKGKDLPLFYIAKYPVTYLQFKVFYDKGAVGYRNQAWRSGMKLKLSDKHDWSQQWKIPNHPAESVSWYDAMAFCRWLTSEYRRAGILEPGQKEIRLPTKEEWKAAAASDPYPWGKEYESGCANVKESGGNDPIYLSRTTAVGIYPDNKSPCGALDMIGNVFEWTLTEKNGTSADLSNTHDLVVHGGSWAEAPRTTTYCSLRAPLTRQSDIGFRVVLVA